MWVNWGDEVFLAANGPIKGPPAATSGVIPIGFCARFPRLIVAEGVKQRSNLLMPDWAAYIIVRVPLFDAPALGATGDADEPMGRPSVLLDGYDVFDVLLSRHTTDHRWPPQLVPNILHCSRFSPAPPFAMACPVLARSQMEFGWVAAPHAQKKQRHFHAGGATTGFLRRGPRGAGSGAPVHCGSDCRGRMAEVTRLRSFAPRDQFGSRAWP